MSANNDLERRVADFYATEATTRAPDWLLESALATINSTKQRRVLIRVPWRLPSMNMYAKLAVAAVAVIAVGAIGLAVLRPASQSPGGPAVSPSPSATGTAVLPSASLSGELTGTFTSGIHGFSISYPTGWSFQPASRPWTSSVPTQASGDGDIIYESASDSPFIALASQPLAGKSGDQWVADLGSATGWDDPCPLEPQPVTIDGAQGSIYGAGACEGILRALTWSEGRGYLVWLYRSSDLEWFKDVLVTMRLEPQSAVEASPSSSP